MPEPTFPTTSLPSNVESATDDPVESLGGADAVEKTTYITGEGTDPCASNHGQIPPVTQSSFGSPILWISFVIALAVVIAYAVGFLA